MVPAGQDPGRRVTAPPEPRSGEKNHPTAGGTVPRGSPTRVFSMHSGVSASSRTAGVFCLSLLLSISILPGSQIVGGDCGLAGHHPRSTARNLCLNVCRLVCRCAQNAFFVWPLLGLLPYQSLPILCSPHNLLVANENAVCVGASHFGDTTLDLKPRNRAGPSWVTPCHPWKSGAGQGVKVLPNRV